MKKDNLLNKYKGKRVLITGGLGFLGSTMARRLASLNVNTTILDYSSKNLAKIKDFENRIKVVIGDLRDEKMLTGLVKNKDIIFNFAAKINHVESSSTPYDDLDINCRGHLTLLESCRKSNKNTKVLFSSSRLVLGKTIENPVTEDHPTNPLGLYGIHKLTVEKYHQMYYRNYGIKTTILRLTNLYGEQSQSEHNNHSILGWFMRLAMENKTIQIHGDGKQLRDYIHVNDAVEAFLLSGISDKTNGNLYNCGFGKSVRFDKMAKMILKIVGSGTIEYVPRPEKFAKEETGNFETDITKIKKAIGWEPVITLKKGLEMMYQSYKKSKDD